MNWRTSRRRISPRTLQRYHAIKNFVRRVFGSSSQPDIKIDSSISMSVLDLKQTLYGIEKQLNTVSKHCQDLATLESRLKLKDNLDSEKSTNTVTKKNKVKETSILYKTSQDQWDKPVNNRPKEIIRDVDAKKQVTDLNKMLNHNDSYNNKDNRTNKLYHRLDPILEIEQTLRKGGNHMASRTSPADLPIYSLHSFKEPRICTHHLDVGYLEAQHQRNRKKIERFEINDRTAKLNNRKEEICRGNKNHRNKYLRPSLDQDFIAEIIRRQYKPVKLFGRRDSEFSLFSAPVCRDQEFPIRKTIQEGSDLCSCCHEKHRRHRHSRYMCSNDLTYMRSICDTRLYSSRKHKHQRKHASNLYNDSTMYDVIPVKEKSSPKSRRKFVEDMLMYDNYREVPPSPRTQRPRLNLQAQFYTDDDEEEIPLERELRHLKRQQRKSLTQNEQDISNMSSEVFIHNRNFKGLQNSQISNNPKPYNEEYVGTTGNLQPSMLAHEKGIINNDTTLNTQTTDVSADKTLSEIKDILQNFLQEIKKESPHDEKFNSLPQSEALQNVKETQQQVRCNNFNNSSSGGYCGLPPFMQSFPNSCCHPILPIYPINCLKNGFVLPTPSCTCTTCANNSKEPNCGSINLKNKNNISQEESNETQKLIKEIHNLISQNPNPIQKKDLHNNNKLASSTNTNEDKKTLTSRSVGGSCKASKHDAKVGTTKLKYYSKSCEAIGSREAMDTRFATNISYSDTVIGKGSGEELTTESASIYEYSNGSIVVNKKKKNTFSKILRSIGIMRRKKTDVIEELTESDCSIRIPKQRPIFKSYPTSPFQQHIINYNMHGQKYFHPPTAPRHQHQYEYCGHPPHYNPRTYCSPTNVNNKMNSQGRHVREQDVVTHCTSPLHIPTPTCANYYDPHYANVPPHVPVCLKEIEVKSIGTQSVRKMSLLQKLTNKMQVPVNASPKQSFTQTSKDKTLRNKPEPKLFDWDKIHEKAMQKSTDPLKFSYKTQKRLAEGDITMRNAMLKKLFHKRNPFSPRNLLVRTLLGKDKSSFGEPPKMYKPKMFL